MVQWKDSVEGSVEGSGGWFGGRVQWKVVWWKGLAESCLVEWFGHGLVEGFGGRLFGGRVWGWFGGRVRRKLVQWKVV